MSVVALAALVPMLVGLPPGATAPAPGAIPVGARVVAIDPALGIVRVDLPRAGLARSIARLKAAPGTRSVEANGQLVVAGTNNPCSVGPPRKGPSLNWWKSAIHLPSRAPVVKDIVVGIADTGADLEQLGPLVGANVQTRDFTDGGDREDVRDEIGHGTLVTSLIAADRKDLGIRGVAMGAPLALARVARDRKCALKDSLLAALRWFREDVSPSVVSVSITTTPSPMLRDSLRQLQLGGTLVVAAAGNFGETHAKQTFPWAEPGVLAVGSVRSKDKVAAKSTRSPRLDLVAPGPGVPAIAMGSSSASTTPDGTSFAAPLVAGAAALLFTARPTWSPDDVAAALRQSARPLGPSKPDRNWGWGVLDVTKALKFQPKRDCALCEPNGWAAAAAAQASPLPSGRKSGSIRARIGEGGDVLDLYPVILGRGQRVTAAAHTAGARVQMALWTHSGRSLGGWSAVGATTSLNTRAPAAGIYLVAVKRKSGYGYYSLRLTRG